MLVTNNREFVLIGERDGTTFERKCYALARGAFFRAESVMMQMARRIAAILLLADKLDANYRACRDHAYAWKAKA